MAVFKMPIALVNMPKYLMPSEPFPDKARVRVSGTGKQLIGLKLFSSPKVMVDIFQSAPGKRMVVINNADVFLGGTDVRVVAIEEPQSIEIHFDRVLKKQVIVKNRAEFYAEKGYILVGHPAAIPKKLTIMGPSKNIANIDTIYTKNYKLEKLNADTSVMIPVIPPPAYNVSCSTRVVRVWAQVQKLIQRRLEGIPVHLMNVPQNIKVSLDKSEIALIVEGGEKIVNNFTPNDLQVYVDYRKFGADSSEVVSPSIVKFKEITCKNLSPSIFRLAENVAVKSGANKTSKLKE